MNTVFFLVSLALLFAATGGGCYCVGLREGKRSRDGEISSLYDRLWDQKKRLLAQKESLGAQQDKWRRRYWEIRTTVESHQKEDGGRQAKKPALEPW